MSAESTPLPDTFTIDDDFPPVEYDQWRAIAEASLSGAPFEKKLVTHTYEGIDVQPVYALRDRPDEPDSEGFPGFAPHVRGASPPGTSVSGWDLRQTYSHPLLQNAKSEIDADLQGGVTSIELRLDAITRSGRDPDNSRAGDFACDGLMLYRLDDLRQLLADVNLEETGIALSAGAAFVPAAATLAALWHQRRVPADKVRGAFRADPLGVLACCGELPVAPSASLEQMADLADWTAKHFPHVRAVAVDTSAYHHAGATAVQDVAFAAATGVSYLRAMTEAGMSIDAAAGQILFSLCVGTHHFLSIAKLRALRRVWSRVVTASGGSDVAMQLHVRTSDRVLTKRDPYVNLLRNTVGVFAAGIGGADVITSVPFDHMLGLPDEFSRRVARNTALILQEESHLNRVVDPVGGSWFLDSLTDEVAAKAWKCFQEIERQGGMLSALESGWIVQQIDSAFAPRAKDIAVRKEGITGVSEFPNLAEEVETRVPANTVALRRAAAENVAAERIEIDATLLASITSGPGRISAAIEAALAGATIGQLSAALGFHEQPAELKKHLEPRSLAAGFEELRMASDDWLKSHGRRPAVFLANMGPVAHHTARAMYSKNFFEAGGFEVVTSDGFVDAETAAAALKASGASTAVICSSDKLYPEFVPQVAPALKTAGARCVVLAGHPGDNETAWRDAGVDRFIFIKCDVLGTLTEMLREEGVVSP